MQSKIEICSICAWRENCNKKFSISGKSIRCPDFVKDMTVKTGEQPAGDKEKK